MSAVDAARDGSRAGRVRRLLARHLGVDTRALAALRVGLGLLLLADLLGRSRDLRAFYTDAGVLPRSTRAAVVSDWFLSVHALSGDLWWQVLLFLVAGVAAIALTVGYRTRVATAVSWVLLVSLHNRMPVVLNGGDVLLRMVLLWAIFLPLGERWAVDALPDGRIVHVAGPNFDIQGAMSAGMQGAWLNRDRGPWDGFATEPDVTIDSFYALADELGV